MKIRDKVEEIFSEGEDELHKETVKISTRDLMRKIAILAINKMRFKVRKKPSPK